MARLVRTFRRDPPQVEKREAIYQSSRLEPLGKPFSRGHKIPAHVAAQGFGETTPQDIMGTACKEIICPPEKIPDPKEHELYIK